MTENADETPFNWQTRLVAIDNGDSVTAQTWNPMTAAWEATVDHPTWPENYRGAADMWVEATNAEQLEANAEAAILLGSRSP